MQAIIPISLKRIAIAQMQQVESGILDYDKATESIQELMQDRSGIVAELTRDFDPEALKAFQYFRLL
jgi:hypothetical protein